MPVVTVRGTPHSQTPRSRVRGRVHWGLWLLTGWITLGSFTLARAGIGPTPPVPDSPVASQLSTDQERPWLRQAQEDSAGHSVALPARPGLQQPHPDQLRLWWRQFDDEGLNRIVDDALRQSTELRQARATLAQAQAAREAIRSGARPQVSSPSSATRTRTDTSTAKVYKVGVSASWEWDWNGAIAANVQAADADIRAAREDLLTTQMSLTAEVAIDYVSWRGAQERLMAAEQGLQTQTETQALIDWKHQAGLASTLDLDQAITATEQTRASIPALRTEIDQYEDALAFLSGRTPMQLNLLMHATTPFPVAAQAPLPDTRQPDARLPLGFPADLLHARPDVRAARATVQAEWARLMVTRRDAEPTFAITGSLGLQAAALSALTHGAAGVAALGLSIDWPIWEGGKREALIAEQQAVWDGVQAAYEGAILAAVQDVEDSLSATAHTRDQSLALRTATESAQRVLDTTRWQYDAGLTDTATLLDKQLSLLDLQTSLISARTEHLLAWVRLFKALGGGWSENTP
jgi:outer membrane protein, multidrug efflux system